MTEIECLLEECIHNDYQACTAPKITLMVPREEEALLYCEQWEPKEEDDEEED